MLASPWFIGLYIACFVALAFRPQIVTGRRALKAAIWFLVCALGMHLLGMPILSIIMASLYSDDGDVAQATLWIDFFVSLTLFISVICLLQSIWQFGQGTATRVGDAIRESRGEVRKAADDTE